MPTKSDARTKTLSRALKEYRIKRDLTLERIAILAGVSASGYCKWENGDVSPSDRILARLKARLPGLANTI